MSVKTVIMEELCENKLVYYIIVDIFTIDGCEMPHARSTVGFKTKAEAEAYISEHG